MKQAFLRAVEIGSLDEEALVIYRELRAMKLSHEEALEEAQFYNDAVLREIEEEATQAEGEEK